MDYQEAQSKRTVRRKLFRVYFASSPYLACPSFSGYIGKKSAVNLTTEGTLLVTFSSERLTTLFERFTGKRIAVVGDLMLDRYYWGSVARISPEAPVPVVEIESESTRLGGAANVSNNIAALGGIPIMVGVIGNDHAGGLLRKIIHESGFPTTGIILDPSRPTTVKTRVIAHHQHVVRIDQEVKHDIDEEVQSRLLDVLRREIQHVDAVILEDYNKGVIVKGLIPEIISLARRHGKIVTVDPKFNNFFEFKHVSVFKPNRKETEEALGWKLTDDDVLVRAGRELVRRLEAENVLLTLGERGMSLFERGGSFIHVPTAARKVADVSGAGDTVISTLTMSLAAGSTVKEASTLANFAGGIVCGEVGIVPVRKEDLFRTVYEHMNHQPEQG